MLGEASVTCKNANRTLPQENKHVKDDYPDHAIDGSVFLRYLGSTESRGNTSPFRDLSWILQWMSITAGGLCQPN